MFLIEEKKLLYVAGHNIVIYNPDERTQFFIPGTEGTDGINFITISHSNKYLAYCEKGLPGDRARCTIYDIVARKLKKIIPDQDPKQQEKETEPYFTSNVFLGCAFSPKAERTHLLTLTGDPDWSVLLWQWDQFKVLQKVQLNRPGIPDDYWLDSNLSFQISMQSMATDLFAAVTGPDLFCYLKIDGNMEM